MTAYLTKIHNFSVGGVKLRLIEGYRKIKLPAKASAWYMLAGATVKAIGFITTPIFTRLLGGADYGAYSYYMSWVGVVMILTSPIVSGSVIYKGLSDSDTNKSSFLLSAATASGLFSLIICTLLFAFSAFFGISRYFVVLILLQTFLDGIVGIYLFKCRYRYHYRRTILISASEAMLSSILGILLISVSDKGYEGRILGLLLGTAIFAVPILLHLFRSYSAVDYLKSLKFIFKNSSPLIPQAVSTAAINQADKLILASSLGAFALAKYSVAHSVGAAVGFLTTAITSALHPWATRRLNAGRTTEIASLVSEIFPIISGIILFLVGLSPEIMRLLAPNEYLDASYAILPIALSALPAFLSGLCTLGLVFKQKGRLTAISSSAAAVSNIFLCFVLIPRFSYVGAGVSLLLSQAVMATINLLLLERANLEGMLQANKIFAQFLKFSIIGVLEVALYPYPAVRILLLIYPAIILINTAVNIRPALLDA